MCSNERAAAAAASAPPPPAPALLPYSLAALKQLNEAAGSPAAVTAPAPAAASPMAPNLLPLDHYRLQLYNYAMAERLRFSHQLSQAQHYPAPLPLYPGYPPYGPRLAFSMSLFHHRALQPEEPKPQHSYIGLIAMAILSSPENKLVLSDIYQYILDNYPYFRTRGPGWRNSIRHNLSLNDCFIKAGRSANGKGHYWAIHPANIEDFKKGDFRRRKAQRKVRKHMGLAVDEEGNDSPSPPPVSGSPPPTLPSVPGLCWAPTPASTAAVFPALQCSGVARKRQFDVASLLAPDDDDDAYGNRKTARRAVAALPPALAPAPAPAASHGYASSGDDDAADEDIDVVTSDQEAEAAPGSKSDPTAGDALEADSERGDRPQAPSQPPGSPPLQPPLSGTWAGGASGAAFQQHPAAFMFPGGGLVNSVEHQLVSRYYEQLAQQQQQRRLLQQHHQHQLQHPAQHQQHPQHHPPQLSHQPPPQPTAPQTPTAPGCSGSPPPRASPLGPDAPGDP